jgi:hypothetical protein
MEHSYGNCFENKLWMMMNFVEPVYYCLSEIALNKFADISATRKLWKEEQNWVRITEPET